MTAVVSVDEVSISLGEQVVVNSVSLEVQAGEMLILIGPNGAGKSTLLGIMAGLLQPSSGRVLLDGESIDTITLQQLATRRAYLAQQAEVQWPMSVRNVVALGRLPFADQDAESGRTAIDRAVSAAHLQELSDRPLHELSGGELMRVHLARLLAVDAPLIFADEPVSALDPYHQLHILDLLRQQVDAGRSAVLVLHDLSLAARFADRVALMRDGCLLAIGTSEHVLTETHLREGFGVDALIDLKSDVPVVLPSGMNR